jgi:hypothetical protein
MSREERYFLWLPLASGPAPLLPNIDEYSRRAHENARQCSASNATLDLANVRGLCLRALRPTHTSGALGARPKYRPHGPHRMAAGHFLGSWSPPIKSLSYIDVMATP